jgi:gliding motility-associated-like protein
LLRCFVKNTPFIQTITTPTMKIFTIPLSVFKRIKFLTLLILCSCNLLFATGWKEDLGKDKGFIENKGQFNITSLTGKKLDVLYAFDGGSEDYYFTKYGVLLSYTQKEKYKKTDEEKVKRIERKKQGFKTQKDWQAFEREGNKVILTQDELDCIWLGASSNVQIIPEIKNTFYHSYQIHIGNNKTQNINYIASYKKLTYKNIYPNIDLIYEFHHAGGLKYSLVLHPGANLNDVQLKYSKDFTLQSDGNIHTSTIFGNIIDHKPITFYADHQNSIIESRYYINNNIIGFKLGHYDATKSIIIDPWTQSPTFNTNWDCVWECERDALGNAYIIGGVMPLQLLKYNAAGNLQWTYNTPYDTTAWMGTFATDLAGNSYITNGTYAAIQKVDNNAGVVWDNPNPGGLFSSTELWTIAFNCDQTKLIVGGTGGFLPPLPYIYDIDMSTGNVLSSVQTNNSNGLFDIEEVRSITACGNGKYYFMTHDSIGYIHQSLNSCLTGGFPFHVDNSYDLGYKCENWRYDNSGIAAIRYYGGFVYTHKGNQVDKRDFNTAAIIATATIPGGVLNNVFLGGNQVGNSGIDIDDCGNVYVGSTNGVYKFDQNLNPVSNFSTSFNVYDVAVSINGDVIACGSTGNSNSNNRTGSVQSFAASACIPQASICCDATVCNVPALCTTDAPFQLVPTTVGGTWSGTGVNASGLFDPSAAGVGTFTITYTLACGTETINIIVNNCTALSVCEELDGTYTVSGGTGPYTWSSFYPATTTPITTQTECVSCGYTWFFGTCLNGIIPVTDCNSPAQWVVYANGVNAPAPTVFPAQVEDNAGTIFTINAAGVVPPCASCPTLVSNFNNVTDAACNGGTGSATITTNGGNGPYNYIWMPGNLSGDTQNNLNPGIYTISITDNNGCTGTATVTINEPAALQVNAFGTINSTCGLPNGAAYANATGGTSPYNYTWSNAGGNLQITSNSTLADTLNNIGAGNYYVLIQDANNCTFTDTLVINTSPSPTANLDASNDAACGANNGSLIVSASGGTGTYTFQWIGISGVIQTNTNIVAIDSLTAVAAGSYLVVITDNSGCSDTLSATINNINAAVLNLVSQNNILCFGDNNGSAIVSASGGSGPYTFVWTNNSIVVQTDSLVVGSDTLVNALPGPYVVEVTDNSGCITNITLNISGPSSPLSIASVLITNASCGNNNGTASVVVNGGTVGSGYQYNWQPSGGNSANAINLAVGSYTITITDANACTTDTTISIINPNGPTVTVTSFTNNTCFNLNNGSASVVASGGTGPLVLQWTSGLGNSSTVNNLPAGVYTVIATDSLGCSGAANVTISQPPLITATLTTSNAYCSTSTGTAQAIATGGTGPLAYEWNNGSTGSTATGFPPGICNVTITDSVGCFQVFSGVILSSGNFTVDAGINATIDAGNSIELIGTGPSGAEFVWSPAEFLSCSTCVTTIATPDVTTLFVLTVTNNGCVATDTVLIEVTEKCGDIFVPSGFSPNGNGINDELKVRGNCIKELDFKIYDRWGELIFQTTDQNIGWDGTYKGKPALAGVYVYYINAVVIGSTINMQGNTTLIRE